MTSYKVHIGIGDDARVSHLNVATLCTTNLKQYKHFYGEVMKMHIEGPILLSEFEKSEQRDFWNIPADVDYDMYHFHRASVPSLIHMRVLHLKNDTPHIHRSYSAYELGSFSLGFPTSDAYGMHAQMEAQGIKSMAPTQVGNIVRADGVPGQYIETIYQGPDFLHCVGIERVNISQLAPCDPQNGYGGPGYSAFVSSQADKEVKFFTEVLDYYTLLDQVWETSEGSALGIESGVPFRFTSFYAQDAQQNYIIMLEFQDGKSVDTGVQSKPPHQGLGMYTFFVRSLDDILEKARSMDITIVSLPRQIKDPIIGDGRACVLESPTGIYFELFEL